MSFIYVASPFSHPNAQTRHQRYLQVSYYTAQLISAGEIPYSPITASYHFAKEFRLPDDAKFWMTHNFAMLNQAANLHVLKLPGWETSIGVAAEIAFWRATRPEIPVVYAELTRTLSGVKCHELVRKDG